MGLTFSSDQQHSAICVVKHRREGSSKERGGHLRSGSGQRTTKEVVSGNNSYGELLGKSDGIGIFKKTTRFCSSLLVVIDSTPASYHS